LQIKLNVLKESWNHVFIAISAYKETTYQVPRKRHITNFLPSKDCCMAKMKNLIV